MSEDVNAVAPGLFDAVASALGSAVEAHGPLQRNYFSLLVSADLASGQRVMVKIPKTDLRVRTNAPVLTEADRLLGRAEYESLCRLHDAWSPEDSRVRWVKPLTYLSDVNAVVTERVDAGEVCGPYRRLALWHRMGRGSAGGRLRDVMRRLGGALGRWHRATAAPMTVEGAEMAARLRQYVGRIEHARGADGSLNAVREACNRFSGQRWETRRAATLKGLDIRNVLEAADGTIWLLDPGKTKLTAREADLARFLLTWRILFWGSPWFVFGVRPHVSIEETFLRAYWDGAPGPPAALHAYLLKETLKHWHTALESAARRGSTPAKSALIRRVYIDPFYRAAARSALRSLA